MACKGKRKKFMKPESAQKLSKAFDFIFEIRYNVSIGGNNV